MRTNSREKVWSKVFEMTFTSWRLLPTFRRSLPITPMVSYTTSRRVSLLRWNTKVMFDGWKALERRETGSGREWEWESERKRVGREGESGRVYVILLRINQLCWMDPKSCFSSFEICLEWSVSHQACTFNVSSLLAPHTEGHFPSLKKGHSVKCSASQFWQLVLLIYSLVFPYPKVHVIVFDSAAVSSYSLFPNQYLHDPALSVTQGRSATFIHRW